ncbi:MAG: amidohydrolase family protein [Cyclobacteriaceae bacterium]
MKSAKAKNPANHLSRRSFLGMSGALVTGMALPLSAKSFLLPVDEPIIDIHQHTNYLGRTAEQLLTHQRAMGITHTILLPSGRALQDRASTNYGESNGLEAQVEPNEAAYQMAKQYPGEFYFGANEVPDIPKTTKTIEKYLKKGGVVIGEQKFNVESDSPEMQKIYELAKEYDVPVLMHWQHGRFNHGLDRFHKMLEKYPDVNFIGHAQTWWGNIDKNHTDQTVMYPKGKVTPGGITDRLLSDYPNMFGDLSAGSGLNSMKRDEEHAKGFLQRHQDKLLYGSDCADLDGLDHTKCQGYQTIQTVKRLSSSKDIERKILYENAKRLFKL